MKSLQDTRKLFCENVTLWLFLLMLALTFLITKRKLAVNLYCILVCLPVIFAVTREEIYDFFSFKSVRVFFALTIYLLISVLWGDDFALVDNILLRALSVWSFVFLLFLMAKYDSAKFLKLDKYIVLFGLAWVLLLFGDADFHREINRDYFSLTAVKRGVFTHHLQVGWMLAVMALLALQRSFQADKYKTVWNLLFAIFLVGLFLSRARGGVVVFAVGFFVWTLVNIRLLGIKQLFTVLFVLGVCPFLCYLRYPKLFSSLIQRGVAGRLDIWQNWYVVWTGSPLNMLFGYGQTSSPENMIGTVQAAHFHNLYLNTLYYGGVVGLIIFLIFIFSVFNGYPGVVLTKWFPIFVGILAGFLTDGDKLFSFTGSFVLCFYLPAFSIVFYERFRPPESF